MKKITFLFLVMASMQSAFGQSTCAEPTTLSGPGLYVVEGINGTDVANPICADNGVITNNAKSEWFVYTPTENFTVTITTNIDENTPRVDTRFHVYTGSCGNLACFAGDDDSGSNYSSVDTFVVTANTTYLIAFDNRWTSNGFTFQLIEQPYEEPAGNPVSFSNTGLSSINSQYNICVVDMNDDGMDDIVGVSSTNIRIHTQGAGGTFSFVDYPTTGRRKYA
ncbi:VCBS repeat-containing protein [Flavobacterium piscinae]|uniref:FG-GAP repeat domain-containing protein n=1 Tax=Flavobacterium piscinae TaxID=2506424 RepID=UPI0019C3C107|nr:VCBS repeat-containing protein [Flavobacterium piscinae]MBC8884321.1 VCBS repeat-containing protein [Flavobacterium piscinae]